METGNGRKTVGTVLPSETAADVKTVGDKPEV